LLPVCQALGYGLRDRGGFIGLRGIPEKFAFAQEREMTAFTIANAGINDQRLVLMPFDGLTFAAPGSATIVLNASQFSPTELHGAPFTVTGDAHVNTVEIFVAGGSFNASAFTLVNWSVGDGFLFHGTTGSETITGTTGDDVFFDKTTDTNGLDVVDGGAGNDLLILNYANDTGNFVSNGAGQITDFSNTNVTYSSIEKFDVTFGEGSDNVTLLAGNDTMRGNGGNDTLNSAAGVAVIDGGNGNDLWAADFSAQGSAKTIDLNLTGTQAAGGGSTYVNVEALSITTGAGNDRMISKTGIALNDVLSGGLGNDTLGVGGGQDNVDGGVGGDDLLIVDYSTGSGNFAMNGAAQITNFAGILVNFANIERFDVKLGAGSDNVQTGSGDDTVSGGAGNDNLRTGAGVAVVDGGSDADTWNADFSAETTAKSIDLTLGGIQSAGGGTTYTNIEAMVISAGSGNDLLISQTGLFNDTINGGDGNDTIGVGGGLDSADGGLGSDDLLIVDYSTKLNSFFMNGAAQITDFSANRVDYNGFEHFDIRLGDGNDNVTTGAGADSASGGAGNDTLNMGVGDAAVIGGSGNDMWTADQSTDNRAKTIDLNLVGPQTASVGTTYDSIERISIATGGGNDSILTRTSGGGSDTIQSGDGNDTVSVGEGLDAVDGGLGTDVLIIDYSAVSGNFSMNGAAQMTNFAGTRIDFANIERFNVTLGAGNDNILLGNQSDTVDGGDGNDVFNTQAGSVRVNGGAGIDTWLGNLSAETADLTFDLNLTGVQTAGGGNTYAKIESISLTTGSGDDQMITQRAVYNDGMSGGAGNDTIMVGGGLDAVNGGADNDLLIIDYSLMTGNFTMNGPTQITNFAGTRVDFTGIEQFNITLNNGTSSITTLNGDDTITAGTNNDVFNTAVGAAVVDGGAGNDYWLADQSADNAAKTIDLNLVGVQIAGNGTTYASIEAISLSTGAGADTIITYNGVFNDAVSTGNGSDTVKVYGGLDSANAGLGFDLLIIDYSLLAGNFSMNGGAQITNFAGTRIDFAGFERIDATFGAGGDNITLSSGNDTVAGGLGNDTLNGGNGSDTMNWRAATTDIVFALNAAGSGSVAAAGVGTDTFTSFQNFWLGSGADSFRGNGANNLLDGGAANDTLSGAQGNDTLIGGDGDDKLEGGASDDQITGGLGIDDMFGDGGNNVFVFSSAAETGSTVKTADTIRDFIAGTDVIDLRLMDAIAGGADDAFNFLGVAAAFGATGDLRLEQSGTATLVHLNLDADAGSEAVIRLANVMAVNLTNTDFLL